MERRCSSPQTRIVGTKRIRAVSFPLFLSEASMLLMRRRLFVAAAAALVLAATHSFGAEQRRSVATVVTIEGEMCGGCVKKI